MEFHYLSYIFGHRFHNNRRTRDKLFFIDNLKERKKKYQNHHLLVINIFEKWNKEVSSKPLPEMENFFPSFIPLYIYVSNHMIKIDSHKFALSHLNHSSYSTILTKYNIIREKEETHNKRVSEYFAQTLPKIWTDIKTQSTINKVTDVRRLLLRQENLNENTKEAIRLGALDENVGLYTSNLLEYLSKRSLEDMDQELEIVDYKGPVVEILEGEYGRWTFSLLKSEKYLPDLRNENDQITTMRVIAKSVATAFKSIEILKGILLNDEFIEISKTLKEFDNEVREIQKLYSEFIFEINKIVFNFSSLGLKGKCPVEKELDIW